MILPIFAYGMGVLKKPAFPVSSHYPELFTFIENMWETMYNARGVGLAAPQVGLSIRIFIVDTIQMEDDKDIDITNGIKKVFINPVIQKLSGDLWSYEEGCLSFPKLTGDIEREEGVRIKYMDDNFNEIIEEFDHINARVILHEFDHLEGILFIDRLKPLKKKLLGRKLEKIKKGTVDVAYKMKFKI